LPADWQRPVPEPVAVPFEDAVRRLAALVGLIEAWESGTAPLASLPVAPGRVVAVTGLSSKLIAAVRPTVCPSADPVVPHSQLRRVEDVVRGACGLPPGVTVHWVGHETGTRDACRCHPDSPFAAPFDRERIVRLVEALADPQRHPGAVSASISSPPPGPKVQVSGSTSSELWQPVVDQFEALAADPTMKAFLCLIRFEAQDPPALEAGDRFAEQKACEVCSPNTWVARRDGGGPSFERVTLAAAVDRSDVEMVWVHDHYTNCRGVERYAALAARAASLVPAAALSRTDMITPPGVACTGRVPHREADRWTWLVLRGLYAAGLLRSAPVPGVRGTAFWFAGTAFAAGAAAFRLGLIPPAATPERVEQPAREVPAWDETARCLRFRGVVCKRYKQPAPDQERVLATFQEDGWPDAVDDPLPPGKLVQTVESLNKRLAYIRFGLNGAGTGVCWRAV
jgi:hypothetical protein